MAGAALVHVVHEQPVEADLPALIERAALAALAQQGVGGAELTVALVDADEIRALNRAYRGLDAETDVLSFGMEEGAPLALPPGAIRYLGDVAISIPRARAQAREYGHGPAREFAFLAVHGVLHLLGHDHQRPGEQRRMRAAEEAVLAALGLVRDGGEDAGSAAASGTGAVVI